jgi:hypothetical protein
VEQTSDEVGADQRPAWIRDREHVTHLVVDRGTVGTRLAVRACGDHRVAWLGAARVSARAGELGGAALVSAPAGVLGNAVWSSDAGSAWRCSASSSGALQLAHSHPAAAMRSAQVRNPSLAVIGLSFRRHGARKAGTGRPLARPNRRRAWPSRRQHARICDRRLSAALAAARASLRERRRLRPMPHPAADPPAGRPTA